MPSFPLFAPKPSFRFPRKLKSDKNLNLHVQQRAQRGGGKTLRRRFWARARFITLKKSDGKENLFPLLIFCNSAKKNFLATPTSASASAAAGGKVIGGFAPD